MGPRTRRAYTLVEVALAVAVGSVLMLAILTMLRKSVRMFSQSNEKMDALQSATMLSEIMHRDLRYMILPVVEMPTETSPGFAPNTDTSNPFADPDADPSADPSAASAADPGGAATEGSCPGSDAGDSSPYLPFKRCNATEGRPDASGGETYDLTDGGSANPTTKFVFYRTKLSRGGGGLFGGDGNIANYDLQRVTYWAFPSGRYDDPQLYGLKRQVQPVRIEKSGEGFRVVDDGSPQEERLYRQFYFRRLVIVLNEAPEAGLKEAGATSSSAPGGTSLSDVIAGITSGSGSGADPSGGAMDQLYFARLLIAGAAAGSGSRVVAKEGETPNSRTQQLDLLYNIIHLDGVTDRFRSRSLARNWNSELPRGEGG